MTKLLSTAKQTLAVITLLIYLGGICDEFIVWSSHTFYHYFTHTLSHHEHMHDQNHIHNHTHSRLIDFALHEIDSEAESHSQHETPAVKTEFKFTDHVPKYITDISTNYSLQSAQKTPYYFILKIGFSRPIIPPPKHS